jgi:hypothetical protein
MTDSRKYYSTLTLRPRGYRLPEDIYDFNKNFRHVKVRYSYTIDLTDLSIPELKNTDSEGYYCNKRGGVSFLLTTMKPGMTLTQALNKALTFFLNRPGGTVTYNDTKYISEYCEESITELLQAYEKMRYEEEYEDEDEECEDVEMDEEDKANDYYSHGFYSH